MPPTTDELLAKYDSSAKSPPVAATAGNDDLLKKYDVGQSSTTTADNEVERKAPPANYGFTPSNAWKNLKEVGSGAVEMGKDILFPQGNTEGQRLKYLGNKYIFDPADRETAQVHLRPILGGRMVIPADLPSLGHAAAAALPLVGPFAASLGEQAGTGDVGGALTKGAATYLGGKALEKVGDVTTTTATKAIPKVGEIGGRVVGGENPVTMTRNAIGDVIHDPTTGEMKPIATKLAKVGGGAVGGWIGYGTHLPEMGPLGAYGGATIGPAAAEWAFPESSARANARSAPPEELKGNPTPFEPAAEPPAPGLQHIGVRPIGQPDVAPAPIERVRPFTANDAGKLSKQMMNVEEPPDPLKEKYPDTRTRQMVHANGEEIVKAIGDDKALMNELHSLKNADVGVAASKLGYEMGQRSVTSSKFEGEKGVGRQQVLDELIRAGHTPREIIKASKPTPAAHRE